MSDHQALEVISNPLRGGGSVTVLKGIPVIASHVAPPPGYQKVKIVGSELLCYLEKVWTSHL